MKKLTVSAIQEGTVIDHIPSDATMKVVNILDLDEVDNIVSVAFNLPSKRKGKKGIIKVGGKALTQKEVDKIAVIASDVTVNIIKDYNVKKKIDVKIEKDIDNVIRCTNPKCITNNESVKTKFRLLSKEPLKVRCHYCERIMAENEIDVL